MNKELWFWYKSSWKMSWHCLGWLESILKPAVMKFWTIQNKGTATHFMANGAQRVNHSFHATEIIFITWRRLCGHSSSNFYLSLLLNSNLRAILCRIWSFKGLASFDLPFVHSAITFCVSRKLQYYYNTIELRTERWQRYLEPHLLYRAACLQTSKEFWLFLFCQPS